MNMRSKYFATSIGVVAGLAITISANARMDQTENPRGSVAVDCSQASGESFDTGLGFWMSVPTGFERMDIGGQSKLVLMQARTDADGATYLHDAVTVWSEILDESKIAAWSEVKIDQSSGLGLMVKQSALPTHDKQQLRLLAISSGRNVLFVQSERPVSAEKLLACFIK